MFLVLISGLALGCLYATVALSYNVMYSTSKVLSMGAGQFAMVGGIVGAWTLGDLGWPIWASLPLVIVVGLIFGWLTELVAIRRTMNGGDDHLWILSTLAVATIVQQGMALWWGTEPRPFPRLIPQDYAGILDQKYWLPIVTAFLMAVGLALFYRKTTIGKIFVALADDTFAVSARGISAIRMRSLSYAIAGALGALAGFMTGQLTYAYFALGLTLTLNGFIALAIGGIGSNIGALAGGIIFGVVTTCVAYVFGSEFQQTIAVGTLVILLTFIPSGLFGKKRVRQV